MKRDPMKILARVRDAAVLDATRELARGLLQERGERQRLVEHEAAIRSELAGTEAAEAARLAPWLAPWLASARATSARQQATVTEAEARVLRLQQALLTRRTDSKIVEAARDRARATASLDQKRADQAAMDEVAGRSRG